MKVRITDLLDQYEDSTVRLPAADRADTSNATGKEIVALKEKKHRFGWREGLAAVGGLAAIAALVLFATGVIRLGGMAGQTVGSPNETGTPTGKETAFADTQNLLVPTQTAEITPTEPVETPDAIPLSDAERTAFNSFLTKFSEQGWTHYDAEEADEYQLISFAHLYYKINDWKSIAYSDGFETLTLDQVNNVLSEYFGKSVSPAEGTDYTALRGENYAQHEQYHDGLFWFPAADGDLHTLFTVCEDAATQLGSEEWRLEFRVYDGGYDVDKAGYSALNVKAAEGLVKEGTLKLAMCGMAILRLTDNGWLLQNYEASFVEEPSTEPSTEHSDDWEEAWPDEYPVEKYKLEPADGKSVFAQTGELNAYRYEQLPAAENYRDILQGYLNDLKAGSGGTLDCGELVTDTETMHDGYANHFASSAAADEPSASLSGSSVTGRFSFSVWPGQYAAQLQGRNVSDRAALEAAARSFVSRFEGITGLLALQDIRDETLEFMLCPANYPETIHVNALTFRFVAVTEAAAHPTLEIQNGLEVPVTCGDSTLNDLAEHSFSVTVLPDGTVAHANNYVTRAAVVPAGTTRMIDESDMDTLLSFLTSFVKNDCIVFTAIRASCFSVYFGSAGIEPTITVEYYYESAPDEQQSTEMVLPGLFE